MTEQQEKQIESFAAFWGRNGPVIEAIQERFGLSRVEVLLAMQVEMAAWMIMAVQEHSKRAGPLLDEAARQIKEGEDWR